MAVKSGLKSSPADPPPRLSLLRLADPEISDGEYDGPDEGWKSSRRPIRALHPTRPPSG